MIEKSSPAVRPSWAGKHILLDTNALVEGHKSPSTFKDVLKCLTDHGCPLMTIEAIKLEFLSKSRSYEELQKKISFHNQTVNAPGLSFHTFEAQTQEMPLLYAFSVQCKSFKAVDFMITAALKKYSTSALLLTNDHSDFTPILFNLLEIFPHESDQGIVPFGLYGFSYTKYQDILKHVQL